MKSIIGGILNRAPVSYAQDKLFVPARSGRNNRERHLGAMEAQSTLFAIVDRVSSSVAATDWKLYRTARSGNPEDRQPVLKHPALSVWAKPNPFYTQTEFMETLQQHFELTGEKWWINVRSEQMPKGPPVELWPVRPDKMFPVPDPKQFISGYNYVSGRTKLSLSVSDVVTAKRPNPLDPYRGLGPIGSLLLDMEGEQAAAEWNANFFRNGAEPGGVIEVPDILSDEDFDRVSQHWNSQHKGVANAHRVAVVEAGQWKDRKFTMRDMQFEQLRRFSRESFRQAWGFPKPLLGDVEDVNRANAEAGEVVFSRWLLVPRLNRWRTMLNDDFLPLFGRLGDGYEFDYDDPIPPNAQQEGQNERLAALNVSSFVREGFDPAATLETFGFPRIEWLGPPKDRFAVDNPPDSDPVEPPPPPENPENPENE